MVQDPIPYPEQIKEQLQIMFLKLLALLGSRKFWAMVFGMLSAIKLFNEGALDGPGLAAAIITAIVAFMATTAWEDVQKMKSLE